MKKSLYIAILITILITPLSKGQNSDNYLKYLKILENYTFTDTLTMEDIFLITNRSHYRKLYISQLQSEINSLSSKISNIKYYINQLNKQLKNAKEVYAKLIVFLYINKNYTPSLSSFLLSSKTINQAYLRLSYLQLITQYLKHTAESIQILKQNLEYQKKLMQQSLKLRKKILKNIARQKSLYKEDYTLLSEIQNNQQIIEILKNELYSYENQRKFLNSVVIKNIAYKQNNALNKTATPNPNSFAYYKGSLPSPLKNAIIIIPFGIHEHKSLKNIKVRNDGIDLTSPSDTIAKAIFKGTVTKIIRLPNNRYAVIINHGNYYTVYSNLAKVYVKENQHIKQNDRIGTIRCTPNERYPKLNFQIWHLTQKLNPQNWIRL